MLDELRHMSRMTRRMSCNRRWLFPAESTCRHVYTSQNGEPARHLFYKRDRSSARLMQSAEYSKPQVSVKTVNLLPLTFYLKFLTVID